MASGEEIKFSLDLDSKGFIEGLEGAKQSLDVLAKMSTRVEGALNFLGEFAPLLAGIYAGFKLLEGAVQTVFEAERIKAVNVQFENLTENAGIAGAALKEGLEKSAKGLIDNTDLLREANKAIILMGHSAERLPELMELARKSTIAFGGDLAQNFETLNMAVSSGQTRMLKHLGIVIDNDKAMASYARSVGKSISELTDADRKQAILNATLEKGQKAFKGVTGDALEGITTWKQFQITIKEIGETLTILFDRVFGGTVKRGLKVAAEAFHDLSNVLKGTFGSSAEQAEQKIKGLDNTIRIHEQNIRRLVDLMNNAPAFKSPEKQAELVRQINVEVAEIERLKKKHEELEETKQKSEKRQPASAREEEPLDLKFAARRTEIAAQTIQDKEKMLELQQRYGTDAEAFEQAELQRETLRQERFGLEIQAIQMKRDAAVITEQEAQNQISEIIAQHYQQRSEMEESHNQRVQRLYDEQLRTAQNAAQGFSAAFASSAQQATKGMTNWGRASQQAVGSFQNRSVQAFKAFGDGSKSASDAAKGFFMGMLSDIAIAQGTFMMLDAFKTFPAVNIPEFAAGGALVALGAALGSIGTGGKGVPAAGGGDYGGGSPYDAGQPGANISANEQQKKSVTIAIQGNYFDTDQTRNRLMDMVREATDATDYKYVQIGQK